MSLPVTREKKCFLTSFNWFYMLMVPLYQNAKAELLTQGDFRARSLGFWDKAYRDVLEVWNPHIQKPILGHKKTHTPSNGSKVMNTYSFKKHEKFRDFQSLITFEQFDGFWIFLCPSIDFWVWWFYFGGFQTSRTSLYALSQNPRLIAWKAPQS